MEVSDQALLVALERCTATAGVVAPRGEKASGDLVIGVPDNLADEGELSFREFGSAAMGYGRSASELNRS